MLSNYPIKLKKYFFLTFSLILLGALSIHVLNASTPINFDALPIPGKTAFWAHNPLAPYQKILFVPSNHALNLRFIDPNVAKAMKEGDILVVESRDKPISWNEAKILKDSLPAPVATLKKVGVIRNNPFEFDNKPWTESIPDADAHAIEKLFRDSLGEVSLSNIQPDAVFHVLYNMARKKARWLGGMDNQIEKDFSLKNKPILVLETMEEIGHSYSEEDLIKVSQFNIDHDTLVKIILYGRDIKSLDKSTPKAEYEKVLESIETVQQAHKEGQLVDAGVIKRNLLWLPKLIKYFEASPHQYFVVAVGSAHFPGSQGILKLLLDKGFSLTPFEQSAPVAMAARPIKATTPQTEAQKKVAIVIEGKANISQKATELLEFALKADPPKLMVNGIAFNPALIKPELLNVSIEILKTTPRLNRIQYRIVLNNYIRTRNALYTDAEIKDKNKALEKLQNDPKLTIEQLRQ